MFRDEEQFRPWEEYAHDDRWGHPHVGALYSEWQLLYAALARECETLDVSLETFLAGPPAAATFAANHQPFITQHIAFRNGLHEAWLPTIKLLVRLQARHWPYVHGSSVMLIDSQSKGHVDALDREYDERTSADDLRTELDLEPEALEATHRWLAERAQHLDPLPQLYDLRRLQPRDERDQERGAAREALDFYDAAELVRRAYRELTGELLPDADQVRYPDVRSRPLGRDRDQLRAALRHQRLYPHRLHMVVEGGTEVRLITRALEAFSGRAREGAGLAISDLGGDKLEGSRTMLEGFSVYADAVALLLADENDAQRVTRRLSKDGVLARGARSALGSQSGGRQLHFPKSSWAWLLRLDPNVARA